ncbi:MAG: hypothetical protein JWM34_4130 [Ilumatobacteraceae bacterium]|nr:hypothetical protein [Ilumatobacteraceae bacterium]
MQVVVAMFHHMRRVVAVTVALASFAGLGTVAFAADPYAVRPYWTGVPTGGFYTECAGIIITKGGYGLVPARSTYTEIKYSSGGTCNNLLNRSAGSFDAVATAYDTAGNICGTTYRSNGANTATMVATADACGGTLGYVAGTSDYYASGGTHSWSGTSS